MKKINILFVCRWNRFRSKIAEAYFNKYNRNKNLNAKSAGMFKGNAIDKGIYDSAKSLGLEIKGKPRGISAKLLKWQNKIIIVANDVPKVIFEDKRYHNNIEVWKIKDTRSHKVEDKNKIGKEIEKKVIRLVNNLSK